MSKLPFNEIMERETILRLGACIRGQPEPSFEAWTDDPIVRDMLKHRGWEAKVHSHRLGLPSSWTFEIPYGSVVFMKRPKNKARTT